MMMHDDDCFLSGGDDGRFPCICRKLHEDRLRDPEQHDTRPHTRGQSLMTDAEKERAAIVAWLREEFSHEYTCDQVDAYMVADALERGDHLENSHD